MKRTQKDVMVGSWLEAHGAIRYGLKVFKEVKSEA